MTRDGSPSRVHVRPVSARRLGGSHNHRLLLILGASPFGIGPGFDREPAWGHAARTPERGAGERLRPGRWSGGGCNVVPQGR